jgi:hypothetical protein
MDSKPALVLLGLVTLFLGGVVGGVLGSALIARPAPSQGAATPGTGPQGSDAALVGAIGELVDEVRRIRNAPAPTGEPSERRPVEDGSAPDLDEDRVVAALDRLTQALQASQGRVSGGGVGITPLVLPAPGSRLAALEALAGRDWEENSREYRFWTFQQVLDRFGRPDEVSDDRWIYFLRSGGDETVFTFQFSQGFLMNIYD